MRLLFVYNADDGLFNTLTDTVHKALSPSTYQCWLCRYTHGTFGMLRPWRDFVRDLPAETVFLHRNEFRRVYGRGRAELPAVLREHPDGRLDTVVAASAMPAAASPEAGMAALVEAIEAYVRREALPSAA